MVEAEAATEAVTETEDMVAVMEVCTVVATEAACTVGELTTEVMEVAEIVTMEDEAEGAEGAEVVDAGEAEAAFAFNFRGKAPVRLAISADFRTVDSTLPQIRAPHSKIKRSLSTRNFPQNRKFTFFWIDFSIALFSNNTNHIQE